MSVLHTPTIIRFQSFANNEIGQNVILRVHHDEYGDNRRNGLVRRNNWECNVATVGFFVGYEGSVTILNEVFQWTIVRGTNNWR